MNGDIVAIHEPGLIYSAINLIKAAAATQGLSAVVATTQGSKAAGAIVLLGAQWAKVYTAHQAWEDSRGEQRLVTMEFKARQPTGAHAAGSPIWIQQPNGKSIQ